MPYHSRTEKTEKPKGSKTSTYEKWKIIEQACRLVGLRVSDNDNDDRRSYQSSTAP